MRNILMTLCYIGTAYHGSQVQANALSVTEVVQDAMETVLQRREDVKGCSRTDSGVHANRFCMNFHTENPIPLYALKRSLNALLPDDIGVLDCQEVPPDFHARYSCVGKRYQYLIWNADGKNFTVGARWNTGGRWIWKSCGRYVKCFLEPMIFGDFAARKQIWRIPCAPFTAVK